MGSEMCIRDRTRADTQRLGLQLVTNDLTGGVDTVDPRLDQGTTAAAGSGTPDSASRSQSPNLQQVIPPSPPTMSVRSPPGLRMSPPMMEDKNRNDQRIPSGAAQLSDVCGAATSGGYHNGLYVPAATTSSQQAVTLTTSVLDTVSTTGVQGTTSVPNTVPTAGVQGNSGAGQWDHNYGASSAMFQPTPDKRKISRQLPALPSPPVDRRDPSSKIPNPSFAGEQLNLPPPVDRSTSSDTNGSRRSSQRRNVSSKRSPGTGTTRFERRA